MTLPANVLLEQLRAEGVGQSAEINPFWAERVAPMGPLLERDDVTPEAVRGALGYYVEPLPPDVASNRDLPLWALLTDAARSRDTSAIPKLHQQTAQVAFFARQGVLDEFMDWADGQRLTYDLNLGRYWWYRRKLTRRLAAASVQASGPYLEIGAGSGRMALMYQEIGLADHVVIVDLPEMLLNAKFTIREARPSATIRENEAPDFSAAPGFWLLRTADIAKVPSASVGIATNINSFMEMAAAVRDFYIAELYRVLRPGGIFFNVNRRQEQMTGLDGRPFDNNPLLYPYRATDRILEWEVDNLQMAGKSATFSSPESWSILRIAQV